jgi:hypothetical protein
VTWYEPRTPPDDRSAAVVSPTQTPATATTPAKRGMKRRMEPNGSRPKTIFRTRVDEAEQTGSVPEDLEAS